MLGKSIDIKGQWENFLTTGNGALLLDLAYDEPTRQFAPLPRLCFLFLFCRPRSTIVPAVVVPSIPDFVSPLTCYAWSTHTQRYMPYVVTMIVRFINDVINKKGER